MRHRVATWKLHGALLVGVVASGCGVEPALSETTSASTVADYQYAGCSTAVVIGLSTQIAQAAGCANPDSFVPFTATNGITISDSSVLPYLVKGARDDLEAVAASSPIQINSALRTIAAQYLLYRWYQQGLCGITAAATVGNSNHEGGRAVDLENYDERISAMAAHGWAHDVPGDPVHFDHTASVDDRGQDVKAFQGLWNANNPSDQIAQDGEYGPQTEARLKLSPATGFAIGPSCAAPDALAANIVSVDGPDSAPPQTKVHYTITVKNSGAVDWPATTQLDVGASSPLYDASWTSATQVTTLGAIVAAGAQTVIDMDVTTPAEANSTAISQAFTLDDAGATLGTITLALTVVPGMTSPTSGDGGDGSGDSGSGSGDGSQTNTGGCDAGGGVGWLALVLPALVMRRRGR